MWNLFWPNSQSIICTLHSLLYAMLCDMYAVYADASCYTIVVFICPKIVSFVSLFYSFFSLFLLLYCCYTIMSRTVFCFFYVTPVMVLHCMLYFFVFFWLQGPFVPFCFHTNTLLHIILNEYKIFGCLLFWNTVMRSSLVQRCQGLSFYGWSFICEHKFSSFFLFSVFSLTNNRFHLHKVHSNC